MIESKMTPAEVLDMLDQRPHVSSVTYTGDDARSAHTAVAALVAERDALREAAQQYLDDYESDSGMQGAKYYAEQFRAALAGAGHE